MEFDNPAFAKEKKMSGIVKAIKERKSKRNWYLGNTELLLVGMVQSFVLIGLGESKIQIVSVFVLVRHVAIC